MSLVEQLLREILEECSRNLRALSQAFLHECLVRSPVTRSSLEVDIVVLVLLAEPSLLHLVLGPLFHHGLLHPRLDHEPVIEVVASIIPATAMALIKEALLDGLVSLFSLAGVLGFLSDKVMFSIRSCYRRGNGGQQRVLFRNSKHRLRFLRGN